MFKIKFSYLPKTIATVLIAMVLFLQSVPAKADVFLYNDPDYDFTFSVPDTWKMQTALTPSTRVRFVALVPADHAYCEVAVERDGRFQIYPKKLMGTVMKHNFDSAFWEEEIARRFINPKLLEVGVSAGLDKGDATMAQITYDMVMDKEEEPIRMYAIMLTSVYGDMRYTMTCAATYQSYPIWGDLFGSIVSSMTLDDRYHVVPTGYYRNFLADKKNVIPHPGLGDIIK